MSQEALVFVVKIYGCEMETILVFLWLILSVTFITKIRIHIQKQNIEIYEVVTRRGDGSRSYFVVFIGCLHFGILPIILLTIRSGYPLKYIAFLKHLNSWQIWPYMPNLVVGMLDVGSPCYVYRLLSFKILYKFEQFLELAPRQELNIKFC